MAYLRKKYYYKEENIPRGLSELYRGFELLEQHPLLSKLMGTVNSRTSHLNGKGSIACVTKSGNVYVNVSAMLQPEEWAYVIAHNLLHLAFGHFDRDRIPADCLYVPALWNKACDIFLARFLSDISFGRPLFPDPAEEYKIRLTDEAKIYRHLFDTEYTGSPDIPAQSYGLNTKTALDMAGLDAPLTYRPGEKNPFVENFSLAVLQSMNSAVSKAGGYDLKEKKDTPVTRASAWFLSHYPLLGGLASSFRIIEDIEICHRYEIHIAAVDASHGKIYANPVCGFNEEEWKFVLAHEYLHAGLCHQDRCQGRDRYLWNVACDYVINDWLHEMKIGEMPAEGLLYDETLHNMSAEAVYDLIVHEMRKYKKHATFRGYGQGDIFGGEGPRFEGMHKGMALDDFFRNALCEGLDYHTVRARGYLPAGLVEEIRALAMPPIPWEVRLGRWFDEQFPPLEKHRTYARPSRRQGSTPDIPRPSYAYKEKELESRTFGVVIDTSGSMCSAQIGLALGAISSYAISKDVPFVRIIFCDAEATDAGYMAPEDIAGRVEVTGRGGTVLQHGIDVLLEAKDFPAFGPILIITDGDIEDHLTIKREHAYLIPNGRRLPFRPKGSVFYMENKCSTLTLL